MTSPKAPSDKQNSNKREPVQKLPWSAPTVHTIDSNETQGKTTSFDRETGDSLAPS